MLLQRMLIAAVLLAADASAAAPQCSWFCDQPVSTCEAVFPKPECVMRGCDDLNCNRYLSTRVIEDEFDDDGCPVANVIARLPDSGDCSPAHGCYFECEQLERGWWECPPPPPQKCEYECENTQCKALKKPAREAVASPDHGAFALGLLAAAVGLAVFINIWAYFREK